MAKIPRISHIQEFKDAGTKFACLTSYDELTAATFDDAGIALILVGDSGAENHLGHESVLAMTLDEIIHLGRAVAKSVEKALVVVDMPFGSYEASVEDAVRNAIRIMKETGAEAVKLEGGVRSKAQIAAIVEAGIPVVGHIGFTPQSVHALGGYKVQGRGDAAEQLMADAQAVQDAGAFAVVLELVPAELATSVTRQLSIPTIGIGAGNGTDGQILVWTDFAGMSAGKPRKFVRQYLNLREQLLGASKKYVEDVVSGDFPNESESFED